MSEPIGDGTASDTVNSEMWSRTHLKGWSAVERHVREHDTDLVKGFNEDIDTLLIFAGLFSAVLTAFIVTSFVLLQEDDTQLSADTLRHISAQIANSALLPVSTPEPFKAANSAVWINSLWFVSLELSLGSALFGMIAKQWLREYMTWTTMSAHVKEILSLRQYRYEAFLDWRVPGIISAIPALLEIAVILFFGGLLILLWTVNSIVAIVSTATVSGSLGLIIFTSVLPVIHPRCPYKSPVGWACVWTWMAIGRIWVRFWAAVWCIPMQARVRLQYNTTIFPNWRARDAASRDRKVNAMTASDKLDVPHLHIETLHRHYAGARHEYARIHYLSSTLQWVRESSQDIHLWNTVEECWHRRISEAALPLAPIVADFSFASEQLGLSSETMCGNLDRLYNVSAFERGVGHISLLHEWRDKNDDSDLMRRLMRLHRTRPGLVPQLARACAYDLSHLIAQMNGTETISWHSILLIMRVAALAAASMHASQDWTCTSQLAPIFRQLLRTPFPYLPGLKTTIFELLVGNVECITEPPFRYSALSFALLALQVASTAQANSVSWTRRDADLFIHISSQSLSDWRTQYLQPGTNDMLKDLLDSMERVAQTSLDQGWPECGAYTSIQTTWIDKLHDLFYPGKNPERARVLQPVYPHALLYTLDKCREKSLFRGDLRHLGNLLGKSTRLAASESRAGTRSCMSAPWDMRGPWDTDFSRLVLTVNCYKNNCKAYYHACS